jgi:hypothetical protein
MGEMRVVALPYTDFPISGIFDTARTTPFCSFNYPGMTRLSLFMNSLPNHY